MSKLLHGVPILEWEGRMMKGEGPGKGKGRKARNPVKVLGFSNNLRQAEVHPSGHKGTEWMDVEDLLPWWTRNNDLREKYKITAEDEEDSVLDAVAALSQAKRIGFSFGIGGGSIRREKEEVASPQVEEPEPEPQPAMKPFTTVKPSQEPASAPHVAPMGIKRIVVDPNASDTWMEDLKDLKEAIGQKQAADQQVLIAQKKAEDAADTVKTYAMALVDKGVTIEWDIPEPVGHVPCKKPGPSRARTEHDIPTSDLSVVRHYRATILKQMVVGRSYNEEDMRVMLQAEKNPTFTRLMGLTFRNHPRLHRAQGNRYKETTFSLLS